MQLKTALVTLNPSLLLAFFIVSAGCTPTGEASYPVLLNGHIDQIKYASGYSPDSGEVEKTDLSLRKGLFLAENGTCFYQLDVLEELRKVPIIQGVSLEKPVIRTIKKSAPCTTHATHNG